MKKLILALLFVSLPTAASAQAVVLGSGDALNCYQVTRNGNPGDKDAIKTCEDALDLDLLTKDQAATHVNVGILYMRSGDFAKSRDHYETAIRLSPELTEAYINYGAALIHTDEPAAAIEALTNAINFGETRETAKLPEAYFNRGIAHDRNQNYKAAYLDFKHALELRPDWAPALAAIKRYDIRKAT